MRIFTWIKKLFLRSVKHLANVLQRDAMPVWVTLVTIIVAGWGTYYFAPKLNVKFENEKIRSAYLLDNLRVINSDNANFISLLGKFNRGILYHKDSWEDIERTSEEMETLITKLQCKVIEYDIIFDDKSSKEIINNYKNSLEELRKAIVDIRNLKGINNVTDNDQKKIFIAAEKYIQITHQLIKLLSSKANISLDVVPIISVQ